MISLVSTLIAILIATAPTPKISLPAVVATSETVLAQRQFSLQQRHAAPGVNAVFKKNIWLNLAYLQKSVTRKQDIDWQQSEQPSEFSVTLLPDQTFAYHDQVLPEYADSVSLTTEAHFSADEGFISDGYLYGDGVCHLASLLNWAAQDAGLALEVTKNHNFAAIPQVPKEYGVSIYANQNIPESGSRRNLYITNNRDEAVRFQFIYLVDELRIVVSEIVNQGA